MGDLCGQAAGSLPESESQDVPGGDAFHSVRAGANRSLDVVEALDVEQPKTKLLVETLKGYGVDNVLIVADSIDKNLYLASRNLHKVDVRTSRALTR